MSGIKMGYIHVDFNIRTTLLRKIHGFVGHIVCARVRCDWTFECKFETLP